MRIPKFFQSVLASGRRSKEIILVVIFITGFPLGLVDVALQFLLRHEQEAFELNRFSEMDAKLVKYQPWASPEMFLKSSLEAIAKRAERKKNSLKILEKALDLVEFYNPGLFTFTIFDEKDRVVSRRGSTESKKVSIKLLSLFRSHLAGVPNVFAPFRGILSTYLGFPSSEQKVGIKLSAGTGWLETSFNPKKTWFFYHIGMRFSMFAHIHRIAYSPMMPLKRLVKKPGGDGINLSLVDMSTGEIFGPDNQEQNSTLKRISLLFELEPNSHFREENFLWACQILDSRFRLIACRKDDTHGFSIAVRRVYLFSAVLIVVFMTILVIGITGMEPQPYVSLRWKLLAFFLLSSGLPLAILSFTASAYLVERKRGLIQDGWQKSSEILQDLDGKLPIGKRLCQTKLREIIKNADLQNPLGLRKFQEALLDFQIQFRATECRLIASSSEVEEFSTKKVISRSTKVLGALMSQVLSKVNGEDLGLSKELKGANFLLSELAGGDVNSMVEGIVRQLGEVFLMALGPFDWYVFTDVIRDRNGAANHLLSVAWQKKSMLKFFLSKTLPKTPLEDETELIAVDSQPQWLPVFKKNKIGHSNDRVYKMVHSFRPTKPISKTLATFIKNLLRTRRLSNSIVSFREKDFLCTGIPGKFLDGFVLIALRPQSPIEKEIAQLKFKLGLFGFLSVGFTCLLGMFLSKKFLHPISKLTEGVLAVREKRFRHRIPPPDRDEFGDLAGLFNNMIENLHQVDLAREVQTKLFPQKPMINGEYHVFGASRPASELGGDYFDYVLIGEGKLLVLIGDVTGHGISAALIMAMSKALVTNFKSTGNEPLSLLEALNRVIHATMGKNLLMTLSALWIDIVSHETTLFNLGHPYPFKRTNQGSLAMVEASGIPLGARSKLIVNPVPFELLQGERLVFYTDGLAESISEDENVNNFELFQPPLYPLISYHLHFLKLVHKCRGNCPGQSGMPNFV